MRKEDIEVIKLIEESIKGTEFVKMEIIVTFEITKKGTTIKEIATTELSKGTVKVT